jgi:hypothetical protein
VVFAFFIGGCDEADVGAIPSEASGQAVTVNDAPSGLISKKCTVLENVMMRTDIPSCPHRFSEDTSEYGEKKVSSFDSDASAANRSSEGEGSAEDADGCFSAQNTSTAYERAVQTAAVNPLAMELVLTSITNTRDCFRWDDKGSVKRRLRNGKRQ